MACKFRYVTKRTQLRDKRQIVCVFFARHRSRRIGIRSFASSVVLDAMLVVVANCQSSQSEQIRSSKRNSNSNFGVRSENFVLVCRKYRELFVRFVPMISIKLSNSNCVCLFAILLSQPLSEWREIVHCVPMNWVAFCAALFCFSRYATPSK